MSLMMDTILNSGVVNMQAKQMEKQECEECGLPTFLDDDGLCNQCSKEIEDRLDNLEKSVLKEFNKSLDKNNNK
jgi:hypothetical protein